MRQDFQTAKSVYLPELVEKLGIPVKRQGGGFGIDFCPICSPTIGHGNKVSLFVVSGIWRWKCFACGHPPSSSIDFVAATNKITAKEAVAFINSEITDIIPVASVATVSREVQETAFPEVLKAIFKLPQSNVAKEYLMKRGIAETLFLEAQKRGLVLSLPGNPYEANNLISGGVEHDLLRKTGLLKEGKKWTAISFRPVVFPQGNFGAEFRINGNPKGDEPKTIRYGRLITPWWWVGKDQKKLLIVEGAIDGLSVVQMGWTGNVMALPGVTSWNPEWIPRIDVRYPGVEIFIGLDSDDAGECQTEKILSQCVKANVKSRRFQCWEFKDWNEALMAGVSF